MGSKLSSQLDHHDSAAFSQPENEWDIQKIADYPVSEWTRVQSERKQLGFDHCARCWSPVAVPFYHGNCHGLHRHDRLKKYKLDAYYMHVSKWSATSDHHADDVLKFSAVSCSWESAVFHLRIRRPCRTLRKARLVNMYLFYSHREGRVLGEYHVPVDCVVQEVYISPSGRVFVMREAVEATGTHRGSAEHATCFKCIQFEDESCSAILDEVQIEGGLVGDDAVIAFDPRFSYRRVGCYVPSSYFESHDINSPDHHQVAHSKLLTYDIDDTKILRHANLARDFDRDVQHPFISYNPEGNIVSVLENNTLHHEISIYDANTLAFLCRLPCYFSSKTPLCSFPKFSINDSFISLPNRTEKGWCVEVYRISRHVPSLQNTCRASLIRSLRRSQINHLPLPKQIISYLKYDSLWD